MAEVETAPVVQARHVVYCGGEDPRGANHNSNSFENIALIQIVCTLPPEV
jgi:isopentenyl diphosphate isomerase/L-lactate dehydrogenase-like FMN-dependent dehydrogenase